MSWQDFEQTVVKIQAQQPLDPRIQALGLSNATVGQLEKEVRGGKDRPPKK